MPIHTSWSSGLAAWGCALAVAGAAAAQPAPPPTPTDRAAITAASARERDRELKLLGIAEMQPPATAFDIGQPGVANYDEARANPNPHLPHPLVMTDGRSVTTAAEWTQRRAEIKAAFDEDVYGRYPAHIPAVNWTVEGVERAEVKGVPALVKHVVGRVDNSADPAISVVIHIDVVTPAAMQGRRVPVIVGAASLHQRPFAFPPGALHRLAQPADPPDAARLLLQHGWGFVGRDSTEVQADNGAGLDRGIIGLVNRGQPRRLDDWGALRAWAWGDSRILDYLQTDPDVDGARVGVMGHSRGGKAALVALADDPRFAIAYLSSSGAGGVDLFRRNYGETLANLASTGEYHWFAANFMRYAARGHSAAELPVDSHEFLALAAPRPVFIGGGALITDPLYAPGDAWQDTRGMFMAAVAASPVWVLLGAKGLGTDVFPPVGTFIDSGDIAFRQHPYGHTPAPNWPYFITFAEREFAQR